MLDWTYNFHTAFYFASVNVCKKLIAKQPLLATHAAIWRLRLPLYSEELEASGFRTIVPPYAGNPNLQAQQGVLTYIYAHDLKNTPVNTTPLDEFFSNLSIKPKKFVPLATKYVFPVNECFECLKTLRQLGYTGAFFFPGYGGVVKSLEEERLNPFSLISR